MTKDTVTMLLSLWKRHNCCNQTLCLDAFFGKGFSAATCTWKGLVACRMHACGQFALQVDKQGLDPPFARWNLESSYNPIVSCCMTAGHKCGPRYSPDQTSVDLDCFATRSDVVPYVPWISARSVKATRTETKHSSQKGKPTNDTELFFRPSSVLQ